jgi:hypothetical protein
LAGDLLRRLTNKPLFLTSFMKLDSSGGMECDHT